MDSPYGSWLARIETADDPDKRKKDSFSVWFQQDISKNTPVKKPGGIVLIDEGKKDDNNNPIYAFWNSEYWAVNGEGFKAEGQHDCSKEKVLVNMG